MPVALTTAHTDTNTKQTQTQNTTPKTQSKSVMQIMSTVNN